MPGDVTTQNIVQVGELPKCSAHWVTKDVLVWRKQQTDTKGVHYHFKLHVSYKGSLEATAEGIQRSEMAIRLHVLNRREQYSRLAKFPHLFGCTLLQVDEPDLMNYPHLLKSQLWLSCETAEGQVVDVTGVQLPGVLDEVFPFEGRLGFLFNPDGDSRLRVWAPTSQTVEVMCWETPQGGEPEIMAMQASAGGVWELYISNSWLWKFYKFRVRVYCPWSLQFEMHEMTDPYSRSLTANGERSQFVDLDDALLKPENWDSHQIPNLRSFSDISVYELHIRDFSISDPTVPPQLRGKYTAFNPDIVRSATGTLSDGLQHLMDLKEAGMTHIHLMPLNDFASVPERAEDQQCFTEDLSQFAPDSEEQQRAVAAVADGDGFNWGYDPVHYGVPDGSYASQPDGFQRTIEFRQLVMGLHQIGYRVVLDVVYNHTAEGMSGKTSVLDKLVPGYYHRREEDGRICGSACGANTASEHAMFEKLLVDDVVHWAVHYKVDAFRFDIMGHLMLHSMKRVREELDALTIEDHGVDGKKIYLYGEGWDFAEMANNKRGRNAQQLNLGGTGIGSFNDRLRDSAMGGSPLAGSQSYQGFITGLALHPNPAYDQGSPRSQMRQLLSFSDLLKVTIAGNLEDYEVCAGTGEWTQGRKFKYHGRIGAYGLLPSENVAYCGCHDNETLFDHIILKAPSDVDLDQRVRMCEMALAMVLLSQGIAFIHAGDDLLRSKSLDRDSYNSGDWFNRIDWTKQTNNYGVGLPPAVKNQQWWDIYRPLLADPALKPGPELIQRCAAHVQSYLKIRYSSPLFRIDTPAFIKKQIVFYNAGLKQLPGVIVMELNSSYSPGDEGIFDPNFKRLVVIFNARPESAMVKFPTSGLELHPELSHSSDYIYSEVEIGRDEVKLPRRNAAVFVELR